MCRRPVSHSQVLHGSNSHDVTTDKRGKKKRVMLAVAMVIGNAGFEYLKGRGKSVKNMRASERGGRICARGLQTDLPRNGGKMLGSYSVEQVVVVVRSLSLPSHGESQLRPGCFSASQVRRSDIFTAARASSGKPAGNKLQGPQRSAGLSVSPANHRRGNLASFCCPLVGE